MPIIYTCTALFYNLTNKVKLILYQKTVSRNLYSSLRFALLRCVVRFGPEKLSSKPDSKPCIVKFVSSCFVNGLDGRTLLEGC